MKSGITTPKYNCLLCNSESHTLLHNRVRHNKTVLNYICDNCGFVFILPRSSSEELQVSRDFIKPKKMFDNPIVSVNT
jgi:transcription elongation factor Elf1